MIKYDRPLPFSNDTTSKEAAEKGRHRARRDRLRVLKAIERRPSTADELQVELGLDHQTGSARVSELQDWFKNKGRPPIVDSGSKRCTRSGRNAIVYRRVLPGEEVPPPEKVSLSAMLNFLFDGDDEITITYRRGERSEQIVDREDLVRMMKSAWFER